MYFVFGRAKHLEHYFFVSFHTKHLFDIVSLYLFVCFNKTMPISWRRENDGFIMTTKLKTETSSQKMEYYGGVIVLPLTPLFSFVTFHLNKRILRMGRHKFNFIMTMYIYVFIQNEIGIIFKLRHFCQRPRSHNASPQLSCQYKVLPLSPNPSVEKLPMPVS